VTKPSWTHAPEDWSWRAAPWADRARVLGIVLGIIVIGLAGSVRL
jgi:hypothetical protein